MTAVDKPIAKFQSTLEKGSVYEAQQFIKTVYHRFRSRKLYQESRDLLKIAACIQLESNEVTCGTELASILIQSYVSERLAAEEIELGRVECILDSFEKTNFSPQEYSSTARAALKWLTSVGDLEAASRLHARIGKYLFKTRDLERMNTASAHLARSGDMQTFAQIISEAVEELSDGEPELLATRSILQVLTLPKKPPAQLLEQANQLNSCLRLQSILKKDSVLAHFNVLLLEALERKSVQLVRLVRRQYGLAISKDPSLEKDLNTIEMIHCGVRPRVGGLEGLMGNLLGSLMG